MFRVQNVQRRSDIVQDHQEALKLRPESATAKAHIGEALLFLKKEKGGLAAVQEAFQMDPDGP